MGPGAHRVFLRGTGAFLPNEPVSNDRIDEVLGPLDEAPDEVRRFLRTVGRRMLKQAGVKTRHFAIDPRTHQLTHSVASMGEVAARRALDAAACAPEDVQLLLLTCPNYDAMTPPTSALLQERLGIERCAEMEIHSNCSGVGKCMQVAHDALQLGRYDTALVVSVQHSSALLRGHYFNQAKLTRSQAALRYILADGAGAVLLEREETPGVDGEGHEIVGTFVESIGGSMEPGMTAGAGLADAVRFDRPGLEVFESGTHHLDQDFASVLRDAGSLMLESFHRMGRSLDLDPETVDHVLCSIPSKKIYDDNRDDFVAAFGNSPDRLRFRGAASGYCGGASLLVHLDDLCRSGELRPGRVVVLHALESSKWMMAGFAVRW